MIGSFSKRHDLPVVTPAAILRCVGRVYSYILPASFLRFAGQFAEELRPRSVMNALRKTVVVGHAVDMQVFHADDPAAIYKMAALLVREVVSSPGDPLMDTGNCLAMLEPLWCAFRQLRVLALYLSQRPFFLAKEAGVLNFSSIGKRGKGFESHVYAHLSRMIRQTFWFTLDRETGIPLAGTALADGQRFDLSTNGAMVDHLDTPHFRQAHTVIVRDGKARLWERERVIAAFALKAGCPWATRLLDRWPGPFTHPAKEGLEGQIKANSDILQHLGMDLVQGRPFGFQYRIRGLLLVEREALAFLLVGIPPLFKQMVGEPAAFLKNGAQLLFFLLAWVETILKHFTHAQIMDLNRTGVKGQGYPGAQAHASDSPFIPAHECGGLLARFGKEPYTSIFYNRIAGQSLERLGALSDSIFAVAMTLLVLDLRTPVADTGAGELQLLGHLGNLAPHFLPHVMSFLTLGIFWVGQQTQLNHFATCNRHLTWIHLAFLFAVSLMPFSTGLLAAFITYRIALAVYWLNLLLLGDALFASWRYARHAGLMKEEVTAEVSSATERRIVFYQAFYVLAVLLCIINTYISIVLLILMQLNSAIAPRIGRLYRF
jgi:uncharacterized membrane protein